MAGIYVHIPYCKQACHYCNFFFSTNPKSRDELIAALCREAALQKDFLPSAIVETIYVGGGTPSLLSYEQLARLFDALARNFSIAANAEITLEANPDDLNEAYLKQLRNLFINRLSIGIQSFDDATLRMLNRPHDSQHAIRAVWAALDAGFDNINADFLYGLPHLSLQGWKSTLEQALSLPVTHLSCYALTIEPRTVFAHWQKSGRWQPADEETVACQMELMMSFMEQAGWLHYEISNFAKSAQCISRHNSAYWLGKPYLGLGPSAHSFIGTSRQWNVSNIHKYISAISEGYIPCTREELTPVQRVNERLLTELRTCWGVDLSSFSNEIQKHLMERGKPFLEGGWLRLHEDRLQLTKAGKLIADKIVLDLMLDYVEA
ncbi:MAG: radical SAM family heme chaperone HemW [Chitinophagales bacterium]|nr:radical SAM family heme chaperone HemW [Chitinophagales bacterium]MDW8426974.1 radical SAM family heme chaperone HemW [Chitinophagales bacterium]